VKHADVERFFALAGQLGGARSLVMSPQQSEKARLIPVYECAFNHTTLMALKFDRGWTYLQIVMPRPCDPALLDRQVARFGADARQMGERQPGLLRPGVELVLNLQQVLLRARALRDVQSGVAQACNDVARRDETILPDKAQKILTSTAAQARAALGQEIEEPD